MGSREAQRGRFDVQAAALTWSFDQQIETYWSHPLSKSRKYIFFALKPFSCTANSR